MINKQRSLKLATSAMAIALCSVSLVMFRGSLSLLSAICIPIILTVFLIKYDRVSYLISVGTLLIITLMFFTTQLIFVFLYIQMAVFLRKLVFSEGLMAKSGVYIIGFGGYLLITVLVLFVGIRLTEFIFEIPLHKMMLNISNGSLVIYLLILTAEALIISTSHYWAARSIIKKIKTVSFKDY